VLPPAQLFLNSSKLQHQIVAFAGWSVAARRAAQAEARALACDQFDLQRTKRQIPEILTEVAA
jgi:hypothetical protein